MKIFVFSENERKINTKENEARTNGGNKDMKAKATIAAANVALTIHGIMFSPYERGNFRIRVNEVD